MLASHYFTGHPKSHCLLLDGRGPTAQALFIDKKPYYLTQVLKQGQDPKFQRA